MDALRVRPGVCLLSRGRPPSGGQRDRNTGRDESPAARKARPFLEANRPGDGLDAELPLPGREQPNFAFGRLPTEDRRGARHLHWDLLRRRNAKRSARSQGKPRGPDASETPLARLAVDAQPEWEAASHFHGDRTRRWLRGRTVQPRVGRRVRRLTERKARFLGWR